MLHLSLCASSDQKPSVHKGVGKASNSNEIVANLATLEGKIGNEWEILFNREAAAVVKRMFGVAAPFNKVTHK